MFSLGTGRELNVYKTFRRRSEDVLDIQFLSCVQGVLYSLLISEVYYSENFEMAIFTISASL